MWDSAHSVANFVGDLEDPFLKARNTFYGDQTFFQHVEVPVACCCVPSLLDSFCFSFVLSCDLVTFFPWEDVLVETY